MNVLTCPHCRKEFEPLVLDGQKKRGHTSMTFSAWVKLLGNGEAIPAGHHALRYASDAGIPDDFVALAWEQFNRNYRETKKRYADWPKVFRKAMEGNWFHLWYINQAGAYLLTTAGLQLQRTIRKTG